MGECAEVEPLRGVQPPAALSGAGACIWTSPAWHHHPSSVGVVPPVTDACRHSLPCSAPHMGLSQPVGLAPPLPLPHPPCLTACCVEGSSTWGGQCACGHRAQLWEWHCVVCCLELHPIGRVYGGSSNLAQLLCWANQGRKMFLYRSYPLLSWADVWPRALSCTQQCKKTFPTLMVQMENVLAILHVQRESKVLGAHSCWRRWWVSDYKNNTKATSLTLPTWVLAVCSSHYSSLTKVWWTQQFRKFTNMAMILQNTERVN